ncbi:MAG: crossover junction endodeoxyribonuclease RuvC [Stagnimonas sp.]|nr:crossover junction endodeoxyribonuclease RuvC [Stagnimonas sp.]
MARRIQSLDQLRRPAATSNARSIRTVAPTVVRILGIDPGSRFTGWGVIEARGVKITHIAHGCIRTGEGVLPPRLRVIHQELAAVIAEHQPQEYAVEEVFMRVNIGTALILGQARGVAVLAGAIAGLPFAEYAPAQIKRAVVGNGRADKAQIQHMVKILLGLSAEQMGTITADAADALAIAICHAHVRGTLAQGIQGKWG